MTAYQDLRGKTATLLGAGVSNMPLAAYLLSLGMELVIRDKKSIEELGEEAQKLADAGVRFCTGDTYMEDIRETYLFRSPGFRPDIPQITEAISRGTQLTSEMEFFLAHCPCPVYAVTGSDGKSTTTTITHLLLTQGLQGTGHQAFLGGNIGYPLAHRLPMVHPEDRVAVELSSFQLMTIEASFTAAAITNVTPNHLNWHTDMDEYTAAKARILSGAKRAVLNWGNTITRKLGEACSVPVTWFSMEPIPTSILRPGDMAITRREDTMVVLHGDGTIQEILRLSDIRLPGIHNAENYMTAIALTWGEVPLSTVRTIASTFGGVEHRLEYVETVDDVNYINSSIDSSPTRTAAALSALGERPIVLICGGYDKNIPFAPLAESVLSNSSVHTLVLTGATSTTIAEAMHASPLWETRVQSGFRLQIEPCFDKAISLAASLAVPGDTVLLSPACASFDVFPNFEVRGHHFKKLVQTLPGTHSIH